MKFKIKMTYLILSLLHLNYSNGFDLFNFILGNNFFKRYLQNVYNSTNSYRNQLAQVRIDSKVSEQENDFTKLRLNINKSALNNLLNTEIPTNQNLKIAFCASGGGYRSTICTLGSLIGAKDIGLLDCVTYIAGLSGSTWAMALWLSSGLDLDAIKNQVIQNLNKNIELINDRGFPKILPEYFPEIMQNLITKHVFDQGLCSADIWGALITSNLFSPLKNAQALKLSEQVIKINNGLFPLPIYTAINPTSKTNYNWLEFTPYEIGNIENNSYIPTWSFGRRFENGYSIDNAPEQSLSFLLGVFGSAYDISPYELVTMFDLKNKMNDFLSSKLLFIPKNMLAKLVNTKDFIKNLLSSHINCDDYYDYRFLPGEISNFNYKIPNISNNKQTDLVIVDAGIDFNLPFPPLLKRNTDIIFVLDSSQIIINGIELQGAKEYANQRLFPFPSINPVGIEKNSITILGLNEYPKTPIIVYMPRVNPIQNFTDEEIKNLKTKVDPKYYESIEKLRTFDVEDCIKEKYCNTFNFSYETQESILLSDMTYLNMIINKEKIIELLKQALDKKNLLSALQRYELERQYNLQ